MSSQRIQFIHALRGIACLLVVFDHLFFSTPHFNIGQYGVGIFFMISGFVIPISARATGSSEYLIRRIFRIYPIAIATTLGIVLLSALDIPAWHKAVTTYNLQITTSSVLAAMFHVWDILNIDPIRPIFWTLVIEEKFYLLFYIIKRISPDISPERVFVVFFPLFFIFLSIAFQTESSYAASVILRNCMFIGFMLLGSVCYFSYVGDLTQKQARIYSIVIALCVLLCLLMGPHGHTLGMKSGFSIIEKFSLYTKKSLLMAYITAYVAFMGVYHMRDNRLLMRVCSSATLTFFANISYPLYVIHLNVSDNLPRLTERNFYKGILPFVVAVAVSYLLHISVERPSINLGRRISRVIKEKSVRRTLKTA